MSAAGTRYSGKSDGLVRSRTIVRSGDRRDTAAIFAFVKAHQAQFPIAPPTVTVTVGGWECAVYWRSPPYYAWLKRTPSNRDQDDAMLTEKVHAVHTWSQGTYGAPRIHVELREEGVSVGPGCALNASSGLAGYAAKQPEQPSVATKIVLRRTWSNATSAPMRRTNSGWPTSPTSRRRQAFFTSRWYSTP